MLEVLYGVMVVLDLRIIGHFSLDRLEEDVQDCEVAVVSALYVVSEEINLIWIDIGVSQKAVDDVLKRKDGKKMSGE